MGVTDSQSAIDLVDNNYKRERAYFDNLYGEITVVLDKVTNRRYALIQKVFVNPTSSLKKYIE